MEMELKKTQVAQQKEIANCWARDKRKISKTFLLMDFKRKP